MPPKYQYRARKTEDVEKRATQKGNDYAGAFIDGVKVYKKRDGENWIRIMPPTWTKEENPEYCNDEGPNHYGIDVWVHEYFGPSGSTGLCNLKMNLDKSCFLCSARMRAEDAGDEDEAKKLKPRKKVLVGLVDMKDEKAGVQFYLMPWGLDRDIAIVSKDRRSGEIYLIDDPDYGYGVFFDVTGKDISTKYVGASLERKSAAITNEQLDYIIEHPLPSVLNYRTNDELEALYGGEPADDDRRDRGRGRDSGRDRDRDREPESIDRGRERSRERDPEPEPERGRRRDPEPGAEERRPTRGDSRDASGATSRSESSEDVTARSETRTSRSREAEPEPSRPTTRSRTTVEDAGTPSSSASATQRQRTRVAEPEPEPAKHSTGGDERPKSRAEQLKERFAKK